MSAQKTPFQILAAAHKDWSEKTFGPDSFGFPVGAVKHLQKEAGELLDAIRDYRRGLAAFEDIETEVADCFLLILDASRRLGIDADELLAIAARKLEINKARQWPPFDPANAGKPIEHIKRGDYA